MDAIKLTRLIEVTGRGDVEREAGRDAHGHQVLCLCLFKCCAGMDAEC